VTAPCEDAINEGLENLQKRGIHTSEARAGFFGENLRGSVKYWWMVVFVMVNRGWWWWLMMVNDGEWWLMMVNGRFFWVYEGNLAEIHWNSLTTIKHGDYGRIWPIYSSINWVVNRRKSAKNGLPVYPRLDMVRKCFLYLLLSSCDISQI
jgi:hypothetical protein